jgi:hypothetical protein
MQQDTHGQKIGILSTPEEVSATVTVIKAGQIHTVSKALAEVRLPGCTTNGWLWNVKPGIPDVLTISRKKI